MDSDTVAADERVAGFSETYKDERIAHLVRLCARGFNRTLIRRLADHGVSFGQWVFLRILWDQEGLTQRQLSELANLTEPTAHTALSKLEKIGIIERRTEGENRRKQHVYLTKKGRSLQSVLEPLAIEANAIAMAGFSKEEEARLREMLILLLQNLTVDELEAEANGLRVPPTRSAAV